MKCNAAQDLFSAAFDGELSVAEEREFKTHLSSCPACSREFALFSKSVRLVSSLPKPSANPFFEQKVLRELKTREVPATRTWGPLLSPRPAVAFAAATVLLALLIVLPQNQPSVENEFAMNELELVEPGNQPVESPAASDVINVPVGSVDKGQLADASSLMWASRTRPAESSPGTGEANLNAAVRTDGGPLEVEFVLDPFLLEGAEVRRVEAASVSSVPDEPVSMTF
jgi:hypothetical protein